MEWPAGKLSLFLLLIGLGSYLCNFNFDVCVNASSVGGELEFKRCERAVKKWVSNSVDVEVKEDKHMLRDLLFFLHIPRTGGRTYFHCFLRKLYPSNLECPRSYDKLRLDPRKPNCRLLTTHDDYSVMSKLPKERTSVVSILRNPLDRVFSTYEFAIEVAARFLVHPNLTSATRMSGRIRKKPNAVSTLDIWPWKYLVPWMREDLFSRREMRRDGQLNHIGSHDSYNMEDMAMPLEEFISHPVSFDIIHNGATFQIAGLTNNSYLEESHEVRHCVQKYHSLGNYVLDVAKRRMDHMLYVGLTEDHKGSANMFAHVVGAQVISQIGTSNSSQEHQANNTSEWNSSVSDSDPEDDHNQSSPTDQQSTNISSPEIIHKTTSVGELMDAYETCIADLWKSQSVRRFRSLTKIHPVNFTKKARVMVPASTLQKIRSLNWLDEELYKYAQGIASRQHDLFKHKLERQGNILMSSFIAPTWEITLMALAFALVAVFVILFLNFGKRSLKVKI